MLKITPEIVAKAKEICNKSLSNPAGYRIKVYCIPADKGFSGEDKEKFETLERLGFESKSNDQLERETRGSDRGIIVDVGRAAWKGSHIVDTGAWAKVGQVVLYQNYAGKADEEPKGSGNMYRLLNDEDIIGFYEESCNEAE